MSEQGSQDHESGEQDEEPEQEQQSKQEEEKPEETEEQEEKSEDGREAEKPSESVPVSSTPEPAPDTVKDVNSKEIETAQQILKLVEKGDREGVAALLEEPRGHEACKVVLSREGVNGQLLMHAIFMHKKKIARLLFEASLKEVRRDGLFFCVRYCKYDIALLLLSQCGIDVNYQRPSDGNTILHCVCSRPKPPVAFIAEICKLKVLRTNSTNFAGFTSVHLLALHSTGVEGRDACQILKAKGTLLDKLTPGNKTALQITKNSFLREILALGVSNRRRQNPLNLLSKQEQDEMDKVPFEKLPKIKDPDLGSLGKAFSAEERGTVKPMKRIPPDEEGELVNRLYTVARQKQEEGMKALSKRVLGDADKQKRPKLSLEEQDMSVERLFGSSQEQADKLKDLVARYLEPSVDPKHITPEDLQDSITRLYTVSIEKSKEKKSYLLSKYLPVSLISEKCGSKKLTASDASEVSKRLHDTAITKQKESMDKLKGQYLTSNKAARVMTCGEWKAMGERLSARPS